jgi:hypothetical protein
MLGLDYSTRYQNAVTHANFFQATAAESRADGAELVSKDWFDWQVIKYLVMWLSSKSVA